MSRKPEFAGALRAYGEAGFVALFGGIYEHSAWVAEAVVKKPGADTDSIEGLAAAMAQVVESAGYEAQLELIRAHPDLAGRAAVSGALTAASTAEQASAGLDRCTPAEYERLQALNPAYKAKFGFPFVLAVRGRTRAVIIAEFERRLSNDTQTEFRTALDEIHTIARLRLQALAEARMNDIAVNPFTGWVDLGQPRLGSRIIAVSDEFFGAAERMLSPNEPVFIPDKYDEHGKWMDGWESRRRRGPGHDFCVIQLGLAGIVHGVDIDTRFFTGNFPSRASLEGCFCALGPPGDDAGWRALVATTSLGANQHHFVEVTDTQPVNYLRLNIFPDGGVARLRVYGEVSPDWPRIDTRHALDLLAIEHGGRALTCSNEHFGSMHNLNVPGRGADMGDGWETSRRRDAGHDWVVLALGAPGVIESVEVDTAHFKGNYPDRVSIETLSLQSSPAGLATDEGVSGDWQVLLAETKLEAHRQHRFAGELRDTGVATHVRMNIFPDGGVSRLRLFGRPAL